MKLESVIVAGLFGQKRLVSIKFRDDLNIVTGKNGSGKTTIMKLTWYIISGQILRALNEVDFTRVRVATSEYDITVTRTGHNTCRVKWIKDGKTTEFTDGGWTDEGDFTNAEDEPDRMMRHIGTSIFFPTFRRIEGGFTSSELDRRSGFSDRVRVASGELEDALNALSSRLSNLNHRFVSALSTSDIEKLLLKQYTDASEDANRIQQETSSKIIEQIKEFKQDKYEAEESEKFID